MSIKSAIKISGVTVLALMLVFAALGPAKLQFRTGFGWQIDHFIGYFALTLTVCVIWPRPLLVGGILTAAAIMLEGLQALTPDRLCDLQGAMYSAGGVVAAMLPAEVMPVFRPGWSFRNAASNGLLSVSRRFGPWMWSRTPSLRPLTPLYVRALALRRGDNHQIG